VTRGSSGYQAAHEYSHNRHSSRAIQGISASAALAGAEITYIV
jgi:hypothetical protein